MSSREVNYLSFGVQDEINILRQVAFCEGIAAYLNTSYHFYQFVFSENDTVENENVTLIYLDQVNHFFEVFAPRMNRDTILFNHAFFYHWIHDLMEDDDRVFIYHKLDLEYLQMKSEGVEAEMVNLHLSRELKLMTICDWLYASSDRLISYFQENHGYNEHRHSLLPELTIKHESGESNKDDFYRTGVHYVHIGAVTNKGIKIIKKVMSVKQNKFTVISNDTRLVSKHGFAKDERFNLVPFTKDALTRVLPHIDYAIIKPISKVNYLVEMETNLGDLLSHGITLLVPTSWRHPIQKVFPSKFIELENLDFSLPSLEDIRREAVVLKVKKHYSLSEFNNAIKFRNAEQLHLNLVNKI